MTRSKTGNRRATGMSKQVPSYTEKDGVAVESHRVNMATGEYKGKVFETKKGKRMQRQRERMEEKRSEVSSEEKDTTQRTADSGSGVEVFDK